MNRKSRNNILISSIFLAVTLFCELYFIFNSPNQIDIVIIVGILNVIFLYMTVNSVLKYIEYITLSDNEKQEEMTKIEKGIYTVAKREEKNSSDRIELLISKLDQLINENNASLEDVIAKETECYKVMTKKNQENMVRIVNSNDRVLKQLVQMSGENKSQNTEIIEAVSDLSKAIEDKSEMAEISNVRKMPRAE